MKGPGLVFVLLSAFLEIGEVHAQGIYQPAEETLHIEGRYRSLGDGRFQLSAGLRFRASSSVDLGWQVALREYRQDDPRLQGHHATVGPLWAYSTGFGGPIGFRLGLHPWFAVSTSIQETPSQTPIGLPYGADSNVLLCTPIHIGEAMHLFPGLSVSAKLARSTRASDPVEKGWDWETGWRATVPISVGVREGLTLEVGYFRPWRAAAYLGEERWDLAVSWSF